MEYGQIAGSKRVNDAIYACFEHITKDDARSFVKKFSQQGGDGPQAMRTFRELLFGGFLGQSGCHVRYELPLDGKKPDWSIVNGEGNVRCILELHCHEGKYSNLYGRLQDKGTAYGPLAKRLKIPYVVGVFPHFFSEVEAEEVEELAQVGPAALFGSYPDWSGILFFADGMGDYRFKYMANGNATMPVVMPSGCFQVNSIPWLQK